MTVVLVILSAICIAEAVFLVHITKDRDKILDRANTLWDQGLVYATIIKLYETNTNYKPTPEEIRGYYHKLRAEILEDNDDKE